MSRLEELPVLWLSAESCGCCVGMLAELQRLGSLNYSFEGENILYHDFNLKTLFKVHAREQMKGFFIVSAAGPPCGLV